MSTPVARRAIDETLRTGLPSATAAFALASPPGRDDRNVPNVGIVAYYAVYAGTPTTEADRLASVKGVVTTTLRLDVTLQAIRDALPAALQLCIFDASADARAHRLAGGPECASDLPRTGLARTDSIAFAGRPWELQVRAPQPTELPGARVGDAWWVAFAGLVATTLLGALLLTVTGRTTRIEAAIDEVRRARAAAEAANAAKGEFLANMSHEIRTPMNAIIGMSYLALSSGMTPQQHGYVSKVQRAAKALLGVIEDILDFSKIEAGKMTVETVSFKLADVMDSVANLLGLKAEDKGIELLFDESPALPQTLMGDPLRLTQVLVNLGGNAVKFTERGVVAIGIAALDTDATRPRCASRCATAAPG